MKAKWSLVKTIALAPVIVPAAATIFLVLSYKPVLTGLVMGALSLFGLLVGIWGLLTALFTDEKVQAKGGIRAAIKTALRYSIGLAGIVLSQLVLAALLLYNAPEKMWSGLTMILWLVFAVGLLNLGLLLLEERAGTATSVSKIFTCFFGRRAAIFIAAFLMCYNVAKLRCGLSERRNTQGDPAF